MTSHEPGELVVPERILLGPGPVNMHPRVLRAMAYPSIGYLDPAFLGIMDDVVSLLRRLFQTQNALTIPISGTGTAGMEAAIYNILEPGDTIVIGTNGFFSQRMADMASRCGAKAVLIEADWGKPVELQAIETALKREGKVKVVAMVHAETSTGVLQPLEEISKLAHSHGALLLVDAVTSLGGSEVAIDRWGIDICYSGTQKCVGSPSGLAPITLNQRAREAIAKRKTKVQSWYLDLSLLEKYWGSERVYHHTAPMNLIYALREALRIIMEEGLEARWARHRLNADALRAGVEAMGLKLLVAPQHRADPLTTVLIPAGIDDAKVRRRLLTEYSIEIGGGLGALRGKVWRVGLMGYSSTQANVLLLLSALEHILRIEGYEAPPGAGVAAANGVYLRG